MGNKPIAYCLLGAVAGDVIGSVHEFSHPKSYDFPLFARESRATDDSVLTLAVADAILHGRDYLYSIREFARSYPHYGYGGFFREWIYSDNPNPYNSYGNGSAMRVSAVGWAFNNAADVLSEAERSAAISHNHPEGIKGAQATAFSVFLARTAKNKKRIKREIANRFGYDLDQTLDEIRPTYEFDETCQGTVPQAILAFLESDGFEDAVRKAVSLGGDADTLAAITGSIAEPYYGGVPTAIVDELKGRVPAPLWEIIEEFSRKFAHYGK